MPINNNYISYEGGESSWYEFNVSSLVDADTAGDKENYIINLFFQKENTYDSVGLRIHDYTTCFLKVVSLVGGVGGGSGGGGAGI